MKIHRLLALLPALLAGLFPCALAEETDEFARATELGFVETSAQRVTPGWSGSEWIDWNGTPFDVKTGLAKNLDYFVDIGDLMPGVTEFADYRDRPYPSCGALHLRCDEGNPGFTLDNICVKYDPMGGSVNPNGGGFEPVFIENAEKFLHEYLKDDTSTIVWPGE